MKLLNHSVFAIAVSLLALGSAASAAPKSQVKERGSVVIDFVLAPPAGSVSTATGSAQLSVDKPKFKSAETAELALTVTGLATGSYSVDGTLTDLTTVHIGDLAVDTSAPAGTEPIVFTLDPAVDADSIASLTVTNTTTTLVELEGAASASSVEWKYIANVRIEAPEIQTENARPVGKGSKVRGHVISQSFIKDSVEKKRHFLWVGFGAPADTELTINVDDVAVGTVTSSKKGKVQFHSLSEEVVLRNIGVVTLTDAAGTPIMEARFEEPQP